MHGEGASGESFFNDGLHLRAEAGLAVSKQAESLDGGAADDIGWIVIKRHEQTGGAQALRARVRDAGDDESEVSTGAPVVACVFGSDLAEEAEQAFGVRSEKLGPLFSDAAGGVGGAVAEPGIV